MKYEVAISLIKPLSHFPQCSASAVINRSAAGCVHNRHQTTGLYWRRGGWTNCAVIITQCFQIYCPNKSYRPTWVGVVFCVISFVKSSAAERLTGPHVATWVTCYVLKKSHYLRFTSTHLCIFHKKKSWMRKKKCPKSMYKTHMKCAEFEWKNSSNNKIK